MARQEREVHPQEGHRNGRWARQNGRACAQCTRGAGGSVCVCVWGGGRPIHGPTLMLSITSSAMDHHLHGSLSFLPPPAPLHASSLPRIGTPPPPI
eukprot:256117-Chlamydomonas_euryale.AAC.1